jgi:hypothetical protein
MILNNVQYMYRFYHFFGRYHWKHRLLCEQSYFDPLIFHLGGAECLFIDSWHLRDAR